MKSSRSCFLLVLLVMLLSACGGGGGGGSNSNSAAGPALVSITVTPTTSSVSNGSTQQFVATGTYSDSSTKDLTVSATWTSTDASIANFSNVTGTNGLATSFTEGTTTIKATSAGVIGTTTLTVTPRDVNVVPITVNGTGCSNSFLNKACVSITICTPGISDTSGCAKVDDILLDTGSFGLRIFKEKLTNVGLRAVSDSSGMLAECVHFGDGSQEWGPIETAGVVLGNEPAIQIPIHIIDSTFASNRPATVCPNAEKSPSDAGFNGILGVGMLTEDCGPGCASAGNGMYFSCNGSGCTGAAVDPINQVQNPVTHLIKDNNGVIVRLPSVPTGGAPSVNGNLVLGIGTRSNNTPSGVTTFTANDASIFPTFTTKFNSNSFPGFIDSGSNGIFFPSPSTSLLPVCSSTSDWFCPSTTTSLSAVNVGASGSSVTVPFQIGNFMSLISNSSIHVFNDIGGPSPGNEFDWGLPFLLGRNVFFGIEGTQSALGTGPYWAY